jgi:predicted dehydrogenase
MNIDTPGDTILLGTEGGLRIPSTDCWNGTFNAPMTIYKEVAGQQTEMKIPLIEREADEPDIFTLKLRAFLDAVIEGGSAPVPTGEILYNQAIIDAIVKSAELGKEVEIQLPKLS